MDHMKFENDQSKWNSGQIFFFFPLMTVIIIIIIISMIAALLISHSCCCCCFCCYFTVLTHSKFGGKWQTQHLQNRPCLSVGLLPGSQKTHNFQLSCNHRSLKRKIKVMTSFKRSLQALSEFMLINSAAFCVQEIHTSEAKTSIFNCKIHFKVTKIKSH